MASISVELKRLADSKQAANYSRFFKTGKGEYAEKDIFLGVKNVYIKKIAKKFSENLSFREIKVLLISPIHEERMVAVLVLVEKYNKAQKEDRKKVFDFYLKNAVFINSWDLIDISAWKIIGDCLLKYRNREILIKLANSENLWKRRISIVATFAFIRKNQFKDTLKISKILLRDEHDLIHKAVGWMLREVGKKDRKLLEKFLKENYANLSRMTLRYAIERFPEDLRLKFLIGPVK